MQAALAIMLLAPMVPMLFMGDEWGSTAPFPFFCDFKGGLADAVRNGRRAEFASAYAKYGNEIPDPLDSSTLESAVLDWGAAEAEPGRRRLGLVRDLLRLRWQQIVPRLAGAAFGEAGVVQDQLLNANWRMGDGATLTLLANLSDRDVTHSPAKSAGTLLWGSELNERVPPWSVVWRLG